MVKGNEKEDKRKKLKVKLKKRRPGSLGLVPLAFAIRSAFCR
jgi:hypothetical protein